MKNQPSTGKVRWIDLSCQSLFAKKIKACRFLAGAIFLFLTIFYSSGIQAQVTVAGSAGAANGSYTTLKLAFDALNLETTQAGNVITVTITASTSETASAVLNQPSVSSWTSLTITPSGGAWTISGSIAGHLIDLNGADNVTIDGLNTGGNALTIENTLSAATPTAIRFINDASNNIVQNSTIKSAGTVGTLGTIFFSTGTVNGNDGNNINNNIITSSGSNFATTAIFSQGTGVGIENSGNIINANTISDYFNATTITAGIGLSNTGNTGWTITNNKLFQSALRLYTAAQTHFGIVIASGSGYTISGNTIGFANSGGTGMTMMVGNSVPLSGTFPTAWNNTGTANATRYVGINCTFTAASTVSEIQNNTIAGFALYTSSGAATTNGIWCGINVTSGNVNIGTSIGNTIGATSGQGSIYTAANTAGGAAVGINVTSTNTVSIQNNNIGAIDAAGALVASGCGGITGIDVAGAAGSFTISGNFIGNPSANNLRAGNLATGTTLSNTGTFVTTSGLGACVGIRSTATGLGQTITNNTLRGFAMSSTASSTSSAFTGIINSGAATGSININNNFLGTASTGLITYAFAIGSGSTLTGISNTAAAAASTLSISNNDIRGITNTVSSAQAQTYIINTATAPHTNINNNTFTNLNVNCTGTTTMISNSVTHAVNTTHNVNNNSIVTAYNRAGTSGNVFFYNAFGSSLSTVTEINTGNNFSNVTLAGTSTLAGWRSADGGTPGSKKTITNNTFSNIIMGTGAISSVMYTGFSDNASPNNNISGNTISNITSGGTVVGFFSDGQNQNFFNNTITGITTTGTGVTAISYSGATVQNCFKNTICNLEANNAAGTVAAILISGGTTYNIYDNRIGDLRTPSTNSANFSLIGIVCNSTTALSNINIYYNTINLSGSSSGAAFNSACIFHATSATATTAALNLRNNILVNNSVPSASGTIAAYVRSNTTFANYASTSNNNLFYAGIPGPQKLIYFDGTNASQTLVAYQGIAGLAPRDAASKTENPNFLSTTCGNSNFLKINTTTPTQVESNAVNIGGITDDFENDIRFGNPGYVGTGTAPDIGADETNATPLSLCSGTPAASTIVGPAAICSGTGTTLSLSTAYTDIGISYQWGTSASPGGPYSNMGTSSTQATGILTVPAYYVCTVSCSFGSSFLTPEKSVLINPLPSVMVSPNSGVICNPGGTAIPLTASGASTYTWAPTTGLTPTTGAVVSANPTISTIYTVTGTDANGCMNTATSSITVGAAISLSSVTAIPSPVCSGDNSVLTANLSIAAPSYCSSTHANGCSGDEIFNVVLGSINNPTTGCGGASHYTYFNPSTGTTTTTLSPGGSPYSLSITFGTDGNQYFGAWIDYNQDGVFSVSEFLGASVNAGISGTTAVNFSVPGTAVNGITRLRIVGGNDNPVTSSQACGVSSSPWGETQDYNVTIAGAIPPFTYLWSPATFLSSTITNPTTAVSVTATTMYVVTVTSADGCSSTGSVSVNMNPIPVLGGPTSVCTGQSIQLTPSVGGTWVSNNMPVATISPSGLVMGVTAGMATFTFTSAAGCMATTGMVMVKPSPSATITAPPSIYQGSAGNMASVPDAGIGATYLWSLSAGMITSGNGTNMISFNAGIAPSMMVNVTVTNSNGCSSSGNVSVNIVVPGPSSMAWQPDYLTAYSCGSVTNCCMDTLCFNLVYTPGVNGYLTTYTTGFFANCLGGMVPLGYNRSCVMNSNNLVVISQCMAIDSILFNSSGIEGNLVLVNAGVPEILHKACFNVETNESLQIREDVITNLTTSIDLLGGGQLTEFPAYATQLFGKPAPVIPANVTVNVDCPADTIAPVPPEILDFCGNTVGVTLVSKTNIPSPMTCEGTQVYHYEYEDCSGYTKPWSYTYHVEYSDFTIATPSGGSIVQCQAETNVVPTPPTVTDNCGNVLVPIITNTGPQVCEGLRFYTFTYTDCEGNNHNWVYGYFIENEPIPNPVDSMKTVTCPLLANVTPTPPVVVDNCGNVLTPLPGSPISTPALLITTCEGSRTFTWNYMDCEGNTQDFKYTYNVEREPFADPADDGSMVTCPAQTNTVPTPPAAIDNCGNAITPTGPMVSAIPACEGTRTYTWTYTDCEGNTANYVYTYTVVRPDFTLPGDDGIFTNCAADADVVPVAPMVTDACSVSLVPVDTIISPQVTCSGFNQIRTYTFVYMDCAGHSHNWVYTYTVNCIPLTLRVFLEGPFVASGDSMRSTLNFNHLLPGQDKTLSPTLSISLQAPYTPFGQPYNTPPWNYAGTEGGNFGDPSSPGAPMIVIPYPADIVDWLLVSVRKNGIFPIHEIWTCAGLVHTDGEVTFPSICPGLNLTPNDSFYILVKHRTHLGVLTPIAADMPCNGYSLSWDFTAQNSFEPLFRSGEKFISPPGRWVMNDANGDQITSMPSIGSGDRNTWKIFQNAYGYNLGDYNMNGQAESGGDESAWKTNQNKSSGIIFY